VNGKSGLNPSGVPEHRRKAVGANRRWTTYPGVYAMVCLVVYSAFDNALALALAQKPPSRQRGR